MSARDTPLRVGIIGTGGISRAHGPGWVAAGVELHAFSVAGASEFAREFGVRLHPSLDSLLASVDAVDVCTPTDTHAGIVRAALDAGKHVICEKPLALDPTGARELADRARAASLHLLPAHVVRFFPQYVAARHAVDEGAIGRLAVLRFERTGTMPAQPWFADEARSGGIVMDQMIHDLDQAIWLAGPVTSVSAVQSERATAGSEVRTAHVVLTHEGGAISHCRGFWGPPGTRFRTTFSLAGDRGRLDHDSAATTGMRFDEVAAAHRDAGGGFLPDVSGMPDPYAAEILELADVIRGRLPAARVDAEDGVRAVEVAAAARESLRTGRRIPC